VFWISETVLVQDIIALTLVNVMDKDNPGWHVQRVDVYTRNQSGQEFRLTLGGSGVYRWLDTKQPGGPAAPLAVLADPALLDQSTSGWLFSLLSQAPVVKGIQY
jgi:hypothetical protein